MKKRSIFIIVLLVIVLVVLGLIFLNKKDVKQEKEDVTDIIKIKKEYESLNDSYIKVTLKENKSFMYINNKKLIKLLDKGTGLIFIGNSRENKSRNLINILNYVNTSIIYYIDESSLNNASKEKLLSINKDFSGSGILIGISAGTITDYYKEEKEKITKEEQSNIKLKLDEIIQKVSGDSCDMEESDC